MLTAPDTLMGSFFTPYTGLPGGGFNRATPAQIQQAMAGMAQANMIPAPEKNDLDNDILFTNRFRINMKAKINSQLSFGGRLAAYIWLPVQFAFSHPKRKE